MEEITRVLKEVMEELKNINEKLDNLSANEEAQLNSIDKWLDMIYGEI